MTKTMALMCTAMMAISMPAWAQVSGSGTQKASTGKQQGERMNPMNRGDADMMMDQMAAWKFKKMDTNGDGMVSEAEHKAFADKMMTMADTNHDGKKSVDEANAMMMKEHDMFMKESGMPDKMTAADKKTMMSKKVEFMFSKVDTNGDHYIDKAEHDKATSMMFSDADTDKNGSLSLDEVKAAKMKEHDEFQQWSGSGK